MAVERAGRFGIYTLFVYLPSASDRSRMILRLFHFFVVRGVSFVLEKLLGMLVSFVSSKNGD